MPSVGQFLALFEAVSRRDWKAVQEIGTKVAQEEQAKKHYDAAHQLFQAVEVASSNSGFDLVGNVAKTTSIAAGSVGTPDLLHPSDVTSIEPPVLSASLRANVAEFMSEWEAEKKLRDQNLSPRQTVLLSGPPGCGKSHLAHYLAHALGMRIFTVRFDTLISSFLGETGGNLRKVFEFVALNRCVLFIDEIDAIAKLRDDRNELGELKRVVISLLQNLDLTHTKSLLIAATNHPHMLDPAIWRRFQAVWELSPPSQQERKALFERYLKNTLPKRLEKILQKATEGLSGAAIEEIAKSVLRKRLLSENLEPSEALVLATIEHLRRQSGPQIAEGNSERLLFLALELKAKYDSKYSFNDLENLTGIPHSTIHNKVGAASERAV